MNNSKWVYIKELGIEVMDTHVNQEQYYSITRKKPSYFKNKPNHPVEQVSYEDCLEFINILNNNDSEYKYKLLSKEEYDYCCGNVDEQSVLDVAWCFENSKKSAQPTKTKQPNNLGLYDMLGNVWTITSEEMGSSLAVRGGSWYYNAKFCRSAQRCSVAPGKRYYFVGFRLARILHFNTFNLEHLLSEDT